MLIGPATYVGFSEASEAQTLFKSKKLFQLSKLSLTPRAWSLGTREWTVYSFLVVESLAFSKLDCSNPAASYTGRRFCYVCEEGL